MVFQWSFCTTSDKLTLSDYLKHAVLMPVEATFQCMCSVGPKPSAFELNTSPHNNA